MKKKGHARQKDEVEKVYETTIKFLCPVRGWVEEVVTVTRYKSRTVEENPYSISILKTIEADPEEDE